MLHGCMLEYLKGKTHEQEVEGLPSVGYQRSIFFNKFMISFFDFVFNSKSGIMAIQHVLFPDV